MDQLVVGAKGSALARLILYSRPGCHLCEEMKAVIERIGQELPLALDEIDISVDPDLERRYGDQIPVLVVDGRRVAKYRISEQDLRRSLRARHA